MNKKNQKLFIIVGVLLLFGGVSLAYFVTKILTNGNGGSTSVTTAVIKGATVNVEGILSFEDLDILPGHRTVSAIKVTATGNNELIPYNLIWKGTNTLTTPLEFTIYKTSEEIDVNATCEKKKQNVSGGQALFEVCTISNIDKLGTEIATGTINKNDSKVTLAKDEFITASPTRQVSYYYVILEYPNLDEPQNYDLEGSIEGEVTVEESDIKPDINILAAYIIQEYGEYKQVDDIPRSGYKVNSEKSTCSNGATPTGITPNITVNNLSKSGTGCYLYFDKYIASDFILAGITVKDSMPNFSQMAVIDEGVFKAEDGMYGGDSYYWRGAVTDNYVKFAGFCWRIVRINGDGSIRMIYDGSTCHVNGANAAERSYVAYNQAYDGGSYVGWTYTERQQRPADNMTATPSNAKTQLDNWFTTNITGNNLEKVADGKYCNDRRTYNTWTTLNVNYRGFSDLWSGNSKKPTLTCDEGDVYTLKVGLITGDEVVYAGAVRGSYNKSFYLVDVQVSGP